MMAYRSDPEICAPRQYYIHPEQPHSHIAIVIVFRANSRMDKAVQIDLIFWPYEPDGIYVE